MATNEETSSAVPSKRSLEAIEPDTNDVRPDAKRIRPDEAGDKQATLAAAPPGTQSDHDRNIGSVVDQELSAATVTEISVPDTSASQSIEKSDRDLPGSEPAVEKNANALPTFQNALSVATPSPDLYDQCHVPFEAHVPSTAQEEKDTQPKTVRDSDIQPERNLTGEETMLAPALADEHADQAINPAAPNQRQGELSQPEEGHHEHQAAASDVGDLRNDAAQSARVVEACGSAGEPAAAATLSMADVVPPSEEDSDGQDELSTDERRPATRSKGRLKSAISQPQETEASHKEDIARIRRELAEQEADLKKREKSLAARDKAQKKRQGEQNVQDNSTRQVNVLQEKNRSLLRDLARRGAGNEQVSDDKLNDDMLHLSKPLANWTRTFYKDFRFAGNTESLTRASQRFFDSSNPLHTPHKQLKDIPARIRTMLASQIVKVLQAPSPIPGLPGAHAAADLVQAINGSGHIAGRQAEINRWRASTNRLVLPQEDQDLDATSQSLVQELMEAVSDAFAELFHKRPDPEASNKLAGIFRDAVKLSVKLRCQEAEYDLLWPQDRRFDQLTMELEGGEDAVSKRRLIQLPLFPGLRKKLAGSTENDKWTIIKRSLVT